MNTNSTSQITNSQHHSSTDLLTEKTTFNLTPNSLLPTETIIELAKYQDVDFGPGNPQERIRYFIKLGLLPSAIRKVPKKDFPLSSFTPNLPENPIGHLPYETVEKLIKIDRLFKRGMSYPKIAKKLKNQEEKLALIKEPDIISLGLKGKPIASKKTLPASLVAKNVLLFSPFACLVVLILTVTLLKVFPSSSSLILNARVTILKRASQNQILGIKSHYQQNPLSIVLQPFTNLAEVIIYGPSPIIE